MTPLDAALAYAARGWPVFPCKPGRKIPATAHGVLDATLDQAQIRAWWTAQPAANIGIATGAPGPDVLDVDVKPEGNGWGAFNELTAAGLTSGITYYVTTPSGGLHAYYTGTSQRNGGIRSRFIDFRGAGGYVIAPPSQVDGNAYVPSGKFGDPGELDWRAVRTLLDPPPDPPAFTQPTRPGSTPAASGRPGDDWAASATWAQILEPHGWRRVRDLGAGRACWCRPGKTGQFTSATTRDDGGLYVFSTSTPFDCEVPYSKFGALTVLEHGGDHTAAAAALRARGYGAHTTTLTTVPQAASAPADANSTAPDAELAQRFPARPIGHLIRDGVPDPEMIALLLYVAGIHVIAGEPDSGKTTVALWLALQLLKTGRPVLMLDEESGAEQVAEKLIALGATEADAQHLTYVEFPGSAWSPADVAELAALMDATRPAMVLFDSAAAFMARAGYDENDAGDVTKWWANVLTPLARQWRAAVVVIDHDAKNGGESRFSRGSSAKLAASDVMIKVTLVRAFTRAENGSLKLTVSKDRRGWLHRFWTVVVKTGDKRLDLVVNEAVNGKESGLDLKPAEEKLLSALDYDPAPIHTLVDRVAAEHGHGLHTSTAKASLGRLLELGLADRLDQGNGRPVLWSLIKSDGAHP